MSRSRHVIGTYDDKAIPAISVEWLEGTDTQCDNQWLYRKLVVPQKVLTCGRDIKDRIGVRLIPFLENGGWRRTRGSDGARIFVTRMFSLN